MDIFLQLLDIIGTAAFAVTGAIRGVRHNLDILGVTVLAIVTGVCGGIMRDVLIGVRPLCFQNEHYLIICILCSVIVLARTDLITRRSEKHWSVVQVFDAIGLGIFTAIGAQRAFEADFGVVGIIMMGMVTSCGGGIIRDVLVREIPLVLRRDFYATASMIGVIAMLLTINFGLNDYGRILLATGVTSGIRFWAMASKLQLPKKIGR